MRFSNYVRLLVDLVNGSSGWSLCLLGHGLEVILDQVFWQGVNFVWHQRGISIQKY